MTFLILESLGSTELLFILIMALVFFGPRKLPQISRSLGRNLADFRRASEDFKTTWHREVSLEEYNILEANDNAAMQRRAPAISDNETLHQPTSTPSVEAVTPDSVVARQPIKPDVNDVADDSRVPSDNSDARSVTNEGNPSRKRDWL